MTREGQQRQISLAQGYQGALRAVAAQAKVGPGTYADVASAIHHKGPELGEPLGAQGCGLDSVAGGA